MGSIAAATGVWDSACASYVTGPSAILCPEQWQIGPEPSAAALVPGQTEVFLVILIPGTCLQISLVPDVYLCLTLDTGYSHCAEACGLVDQSRLGFRGRQAISVHLVTSSLTCRVAVSEHVTFDPGSMRLDWLVLLATVALTTASGYLNQQGS